MPTSIRVIMEMLVCMKRQMMKFSLVKPSHEKFIVLAMPMPLMMIRLKPIRIRRSRI
jgi:hypothetical protein